MRAVLGDGGRHADRRHILDGARPDVPTSWAFGASSLDHPVLGVGAARETTSSDHAVPTSARTGEARARPGRHRDPVPARVGVHRQRERSRFPCPCDRRERDGGRLRRRTSGQAAASSAGPVRSSERAEATCRFSVTVRTLAAALEFVREIAPDQSLAPQRGVRAGQEPRRRAPGSMAAHPGLGTAGDRGAGAANEVERSERRCPPPPSASRRGLGAARPRTTRRGTTR